MFKFPVALDIVSRTTLASGDVYVIVCVDVYVTHGCGGADAEHLGSAVPPEPGEVHISQEFAEGVSETEHSGELLAEVAFPMEESE